jgi:putative SOS response-associated peptidase YedK
VRFVPEKVHSSGDQSVELDTTSTFRDAWERGPRCLVFTASTWRKPEKQPFAVGMLDGGQTVMAGLWDE